MLAGSGNDALATRLFHQDASDDHLHRDPLNGDMSSPAHADSRFLVGGGQDTHPSTTNGGFTRGADGNSCHMSHVGSASKPPATYEAAPPPPGRVSTNLRKSLWQKNEPPSSSSSSDSEGDDRSNSSGWRAASQRSTPKNRSDMGALEVASMTTSDWTWVEPSDRN